MSSRQLTTLAAYYSWMFSIQPLLLTKCEIFLKLRNQRLDYTPCMTLTSHGDETFVFYLCCRNVYGSTRTEKQTRLQPRGFTCCCVVCTQPETVVNDEQRVRVKELWESIPYSSAPTQSRQCLLAIARAIHSPKEVRKEGYAADHDDSTNGAASVHSDWVFVKYWTAET